MRPWPHSLQTDAAPWSDWEDLLRGGLPTDWSALLAALEPAVAMISDIRAVWEHHLPPTGPLRTLFTDELWLHRAGDHRSPIRGDALRQALSVLDLSIDLTPVRALLTGPARRAAAPLLEGLESEVAFYRGLQQARRLLGGIPDRPEVCREAADDLRVGLAWLDQAAPWRESWEVQARGVMGSVPLTGSWFVRGIIRLALHRVRRDQDAAIRALLHEPAPGALRYYAACPPDADSLGLALQLAAAIPDPPRARIASWLDVMHAHTRDGLVPTWLGAGPVRWSGADCPAVRLSLVCGLLAWDREGLGALALRNLHAARSTLHRRYHYTAAYTELLLHRALQAAPKTADLEAAHDALIARLLHDQEDDGGWGGVLQTACALQILAESGAPAQTLLRAIRYSGDAQRSDGAWPEAPLYAIPLPRGRVGWHCGRALSCALTTQALHTALHALGSDHVHFRS